MNSEHEHVFERATIRYRDGRVIPDGRRCACGMEVVGNGMFALSADFVRACEQANRAVGEMFIRMGRVMSKEDTGGEVKTSDALMRAADALESGGYEWTQGEGWDYQKSGCMCLEGAILFGQGKTIPTIDNGDGERDAALDKLRESDEYVAVRDTLANRWTRLYHWNDMSGRTRSEVIELLRRAAARARK